jgi:transcriptional regulator with XRE-family HTH domain
VGARRRPADIGTERGRALLGTLLREETIARRDRGLSLDAVGRAVGLSASMLSRTEGGRVPDVAVVRMAALLEVVGLELWAKAYPGGAPIRDAAHAALIARFRACLHPALMWDTEVPMPRIGDLRGWDGFIRGRGWRYGVEAETQPTDGQGLARRLRSKVRDGDVDGVVLVLAATRHTRGFLAVAGDLLAPIFPVRGPRARDLLRAGIDPGGSALVVL